MICQICGSGSVKELSMGQSQGDHFYCPACKGHLFKGQWINRKDWAAWIEEEVKK